VRILHLIDAGSPGAGPCSLRLLADTVKRLEGIDHEVVVVGNGAHLALAQRCGVGAVGAVAPPTRLVARPPGGLRRLVARRPRAGAGFDLIHAWTGRCAALAARAAPRRALVVTLPVGPPPRSVATRFVLWALRRSSARFLAASSAVEQAYRALRLNGSRMTVLAPGVEPAEAGTTAAAVRRRWAVGEETCMVGLLSETPGSADARATVTVVTLVARAGRPIKLVVDPEVRHRAQAQQWARRVGHADSLLLDPEIATPWRVVAGLDAALLIGAPRRASGGDRDETIGGVGPLLCAMAGGVPVVAEINPVTTEVITDNRDGFLVGPHDTGAAAQRLMALIDDRAEAARVGAAGRARVSRAYQMDAYCGRLRAVYEEVA
jgi:hypothetical protein